jgi:Phage portal protein, SPP1 Gp6-like.
MFKVDAVWPPESEQDRLDTYDRNEKLFSNEHVEVFGQMYNDLDEEITLLRMNWFKRIPTFFADLLVGVPPAIATPNQDYTDDLLEHVKFQQVLYNAIIDLMKFGNAVIKVRFFNRRARMSILDPACWFPVVDPLDKSLITAQVIAWIEEGEDGSDAVLRVEVHKPGSYETRTYALKSGVDTYSIAKEVGSRQTYSSLVKGSLVIPLQNVPSLAEPVIGMNDLRT